jgi:hypothetical protein
MSTHELPASVIKLMVDLSTAHMTAMDNRRCSKLAKEDLSGATPRIVAHAYGYIIFVTSDPEAVQRYLRGLRKAGFSQAFIDIYRRAATSEKIMLINFDRDADQSDKLPSFDWTARPKLIDPNAKEHHDGR